MPNPYEEARMRRDVALLRAVERYDATVPLSAHADGLINALVLACTQPTTSKADRFRAWEALRTWIGGLECERVPYFTIVVAALPCSNDPPAHVAPCSADGTREKAA